MLRLLAFGTVLALLGAGCGATPAPPKPESAPEAPPAPREVVPVVHAPPSPVEPRGKARGLAEPPARGAPKGKPLLVLDAEGHTAAIGHVFFTPSGKELLSVSHDKTVRVWDVASGRTRSVLRPPIGPGKEGVLYAAALSPDGKTLAVAGHGCAEGGASGHPVFLLDWAAGRVVGLLEGHASPVQALAFTADGKRLASGDQFGEVRLWDVSSRKSVRALPASKKGIKGLAFSPDGRSLAVAAHEPTVRIWAVATGKVGVELVHRGWRGPDVLEALAWSPDGKALAIGGGRTVRLWSPNGKEQDWSSDLKRAEGVRSLQFTRDSRGLLITADAYGYLHAVVHDVETAEHRHAFASPAFPRRLPPATGPHGFTAGALSADAKLAATAVIPANAVLVWPLAAPENYRRLGQEDRFISNAAWAKTGRTIAWTHDRRGGVGKARPDRAFDFLTLALGKAKDKEYQGAFEALGPLSTRVVNAGLIELLRDGERVAGFIHGGHGFGPATLLPGDFFAAGGRKGDVLFFRTDGKDGPRSFRKPLKVVPGHNGIVWVRPTTDGRFLLSWARDPFLHVWDVRKQAILLSLFVRENDWVAWTPEGYYAASPGGERLMGWQVNNGPDKLASFYPAAQFRRSLYRPDVIKLLLREGSVKKALAAADKPVRGASRLAEAARKAGRKIAPILNVAQVLPPSVSLRLVKQEGRRVDVVAKARSANQPLTSVWILLDGRPLDGEKYRVRFQLAKARAIEQSWSVELPPGPHRLSVAARTLVSQGRSNEVEATFTPAKAKDRRPALYLLAVGIDAYPGDYRLDCAGNDARELKKALEKGGKGLFREVQTRLLLDKGANLAAIRQGLQWLKAEMKANDVAVVFYAGHGFKDEEGRFFLLPHDANLSAPADKGLSGTELKERLAGIKGRVLLLLDACHSGAYKAGRAGKRASPADDLARELTDDDCGVVVMCAAMGAEESQENKEKRHGFFTLALLEGMKGKADYNRDGLIHLTELELYVDNRVTELSRDEQHPVTLKPGPVRSFALVRLETGGPPG